jgi:hypothetical protein
LAPLPRRQLPRSRLPALGRHAGPLRGRARSGAQGDTQRFVFTSERVEIAADESGRIGAAIITDAAFAVCCWRRGSARRRRARRVIEGEDSSRAPPRVRDRRPTDTGKPSWSERDVLRGWSDLYGVSVLITKAESACETTASRSRCASM